MFGWFSPKCPVRTAEKTWTERRMLWLVERFGLERLRLAEVILPTDDYFPERYRGTSKDARRIFERLYLLRSEPFDHGKHRTSSGALGRPRTPRHP